MNKKNVAYWVLTSVFCLALGMSGVLNLLRSEAMQESITGLGYPIYLMSILGVAKVLGVVALVLPRTPRLKEWAYAGFTFDMLGASASHAFSGHSVPELCIPLVVLSIAVGSYCLRPDNRRLASIQRDRQLDTSGALKGDKV